MLVPHDMVTTPRLLTCEADLYIKHQRDGSRVIYLGPNIGISPADRLAVLDLLLGPNWPGREFFL